MYPYENEQTGDGRRQNNLANLGLQTLFGQVDIQLNQKVITSSCSYCPYNDYLDAILNIGAKMPQGFERMSYCAKIMDNDSNNNVSFDSRYKQTSTGNTVF